MGTIDILSRLLRQKVARVRMTAGMQNPLRVLICDFLTVA